MRVRNFSTKLVLATAFTLVAQSVLHRRRTVQVGPMNYALYINLDRRHDRRNEIEHELRLANIAAHRIKATDVHLDEVILQSCWNYTDQLQRQRCAGKLGCQLSHIQALEHAAALQWPQVAIFEDDFKWKTEVDPNYVLTAVKSVIQQVPDWDVIALSLRILEQNDVLGTSPVQLGPRFVVNITKITSAVTTHGYLIRRRMYGRLLEVFRSCNTTGVDWIAIDTCWLELQQVTKWYGMRPQMATQRASYSDIEGRHVSYANIVK